jgi:hypothetical protein
MALNVLKLITGKLFMCRNFALYNKLCDERDIWKTSQASPVKFAFTCLLSNYWQWHCKVMSSKLDQLWTSFTVSFRKKCQSMLQLNITCTRHAINVNRYVNFCHFHVSH